LSVLPEVGESPLPRKNHRFGHPTPQRGVEVERKWKRPDYHVPGNGLVQIQRTKRKEREHGQTDSSAVAEVRHAGRTTLPTGASSGRACRSRARRFRGAARSARLWRSRIAARSAWWWQQNS